MKNKYLDAVDRSSAELLKIRKLERDLEREGDTVGKSLLGDEVQKVYDMYREVLEGTPEEIYLASLASYFKPEANYDVKIEDLDLSTRVRNRLKEDRIDYIGQLVQYSEAEMLRIPNFSEVSLKELKKKLKEMNLSFSEFSEKNSYSHPKLYIPSEERDNQ